MVQKLAELTEKTTVKVALGVFAGMLFVTATGTWTVAKALESFTDSLETRFRGSEEKIREMERHQVHNWSWQMETELWNEYDRTDGMSFPDPSVVHKKWQWLYEN